MNWLIIWLFIYSAVIVFLTLKHGKIKDLESYLINNRSTNTLQLVFTTLATFVGGGVSVGLMAMGYEAGLAAVAIGIAYVIGFIITSFFAEKINKIGKETNIYSFSEFLIKNFTSHEYPIFTKLFSSVVNSINIFIFFFLLAAQFVGMASLLEYSIGVGYQYAALISAFIVIAYTTFAGLSGVILTDMLQFIIITIMIIIIFIPGVISDTSGLILLKELPNEMLSGTSYGYIFLIALPLFLSPSVLVRLDIWQRLLSAKNGYTAKKASIVSGFCMLPFYIIFPLVGMAVKLSKEIEPKYAAFTFLSSHCSDFLLGFAVVGLLSALMSSGDSFLNLISISAVKDYIGWKKKNHKNMQQYKAIRMMTIFFGSISFIVSIVFPKIVDLMVVGTTTIVIFAPCTIFALVKKTPYMYNYSALFSIISGFIVNLVFFTFGVVSPDKFQAKSSFVPAFIISLITFIISTKIEKMLIIKRNSLKFDSLSQETMKDS